MDQSRPMFTDRWGGSFHLIEPGEFVMGDSVGSGARHEHPPHSLTIESPFFFGERLVTHAQWLDVMGENPSKFQEGWSAGLRPVESICFDEVMVFLEQLNQLEGDQERLGFIGKWRIPSESEWEYVARCGTKGRWWFGNSDTELDDYGWHAGNAGSSTREVGLKKPNSWGIHDMNGLVAEWCMDHWVRNYDVRRKQKPFTIEGTTRRVIRGGSWFTESDSTRSSARSSADESKSSDGIGLRLIWEPQTPS